MRSLVAKKIVLVLTIFIILMKVPVLATYLEGLFYLNRGSEKLAMVEKQMGHTDTLNESIDDLRRASTLLPYDPLPLRRLAQALQQADQLDEAINVLERAATLQSPLAKQELMLSYHAVGKRNETLEAELGFNLEKCIAIGDEFLNLGDGVGAAVWYQTAVQFWPAQSNALIFRQLIAFIQAQDEAVWQLLPIAAETHPDLYISVDEPSVTVNGSMMRWVPWGESLNTPYGGPNATFWYNGRGALVAVITQTGQYRIRATISEASPPPVEMAFGLNGRIIQPFSLTKGDNTWSTIDFELTITQPIVTIDFWFFNDLWIPSEGISRDPIIKDVQIERISQ